MFCFRQPGRRTRFLLVAAAITPIAAWAGGFSDGRTGPTAFDGHALDHAMTDLNDYLQAKYAQDEMLANLDAAPQGDFVTIATAVSTTPLNTSTSEAGAFGWQITGGSSLDLHLASFNSEVLARGDDLFIRIAKVETGKAIDFRSVASDVYAGQAFDGRIMNDPTLEAELQALHRGLAEFESRAERLGQAVPAVTDSSFDRYIESLRLF